MDSCGEEGRSEACQLGRYVRALCREPLLLHSTQSKDTRFAEVAGNAQPSELGTRLGGLSAKREASPESHASSLWERPIVGRLRGDPAPRKRGSLPVPRPVCGRFRPTSDPGRWSCSAPSKMGNGAILSGSALPFADHRSGRTPLSSVDPTHDLELFDSLFLPFPPAPLEAAPFVSVVLFVLFALLPDGLLEASWSALAAFL